MTIKKELRVKQVITEYFPMLRSFPSCILDIKSETERED